jgi:glucosamine--fructose-6-phosphate aminotransferase (isomerizing)
VREKEINMCGIVGYVGPRAALDVLIPGLEGLEYRGYDSAGVALIGANGLAVTKTAGRMADLVAALEVEPVAGSVGIGHTRWATHGAPTTGNAHPHRDCDGTIAVIHNGIVENWAVLRAKLIAAGHEFASDTDTEVLAHLIEDRADMDLADAVRDVMKLADGALAIAVVRTDEPERIVAARRGSPLVIGRGDGENFLASDIPAFLRHTKKVIAVDDDRVVDLTADSIVITDLDGNETPISEREIEWDLEAAEKGGYPTFMLKEINEQPTSITDTLRGRIDETGRITFSELELDDKVVRMIDKVFVIACGTSYHAAMMAKYAIERWTRLPVEIDIASEFRYRDPVLDDRSLVIGISQSGETIDTLAAIRYAKAQGATVVGLSNVVDSALARDADAVLYTRSGPEIGVAATKTFTTQLVMLQLFGLYLAQHRGTLDPGTVGNLVAAVKDLPQTVERALGLEDQIREMTGEWANTRDFFFLGRAGDFPVAMEGALKLKEIAYVRAEGYPAGEMKHGPISLIEKGVVVIGIATDSHVRSKTLSNMEEMKARGGTIVMVVEEGSEDEVASVADHIIAVPNSPDLICTVNAVIPLQFLAYHIANAKGLDVDKPRNLAKTVTVE